MYGPLLPFNQTLTLPLSRALVSALSQYCTESQTSSTERLIFKIFSVVPLVLRGFWATAHPVVEELFKYFTEVKILIPHCKRLLELQQVL